MIYLRVEVDVAALRVADEVDAERGADVVLLLRVAEAPLRVVVAVPELLTRLLIVPCTDCAREGEDVVAEVVACLGAEVVVVWRVVVPVRLVVVEGVAIRVVEDEVA